MRFQAVEFKNIGLKYLIVLYIFSDSIYTDLVLIFYRVLVNILGNVHAEVFSMTLTDLMNWGLQKFLGS